MGIQVPIDFELVFLLMHDSFDFHLSSNLTSSEVTVPVDNEDADLTVPMIEVLTTPENEEEAAYAETSANEVIPGEAESVAQLEKHLGTANVLNVTNNVTRNNESGSSEDDIPSFSEWTLKVLAEEEKSGEILFVFLLFKIN